jgi:hypothetical protein
MYDVKDIRPVTSSIVCQSIVSSLPPGRMSAELGNGRQTLD